LLATNNNGDKLEIYKNVTLLHREISEKQKIEVYDIPM
jgi:ribosomal protein S18